MTARLDGSGGDQLEHIARRRPGRSRLLSDRGELEGARRERLIAHDDLEPVLRACARNRIDPTRQRELHRPAGRVGVDLHARRDRLRLEEDIALQAVRQVEQRDLEIAVGRVLQMHEDGGRRAVRPVLDRVLTGGRIGIPIGRQGRLVRLGGVDPQLHRIGERRAMAAELAELLPPGHVFQLPHECRRGAGRIAARDRRRRTGDGR